MAKGYEVLQMLIPMGGWVISGDNFEGIQFLECEPITKQQFDNGFAAYDALKAQQESERAAAKAALLERLGITAEEAALLLGGN
jgi:hypothetical protein